MNSEEIISKYKLNESTWTHKGFHAILHTFFIVSSEAFRGPIEHYGYNMESSLYFTKDDYVNWFWHDKSMRRVRKQFIDEVNADPEFLEDLKKRWLLLQIDLDNCLDKVEKIDVSKLNDEDLLTTYENLCLVYREWFGICMAPQDAFSMYSAEFLEPLFLKILEDKGMEEKFYSYYPILMSPVDKSFITEEEEDLLKILIEKRKNKNVSELLEKHQQKYFWIKNNYAVQERLPVDYFADRLKKLDNKIKNPEEELKKADNFIKETKQKKKEIINELKLDQEFLNLIKISELFAYIQDQRKKRVTRCNNYQRLFFEEIGKRLDVPVEEMEYTVYPELREMLMDGKIDRKKLQSRKRHSLCIYTKDGWHIFDGKAVDEVYEQIFEIKTEGITELKGTVASPGQSTGKIRIINRISDIENMQKGEIIVSSMTRPDMVVAMKKAAAIITDEGGITSHAAIVSRELGIPCILGTKIATKVLQNGDTVEVDANNGIVKKL